MKIEITSSTYDSAGRLLPEGVAYEVPGDVSREDAEILVRAKKARWVEAPAKAGKKRARQ